MRLLGLSERATAAQKGWPEKAVENLGEGINLAEGDKISVSVQLPRSWDAQAVIGAWPGWPATRSSHARIAG